MPFTVEHLGLAARNPATLGGWYARTLGARILWTNDRPPPACLLELPGGLLLEIYACDFSFTGTADNALRGWRHLALRVDSIDAARQELLGSGVEILEPAKPAGGGGQVLFFKDPEGNLLHCVERPADSPVAKATRQNGIAPSLPHR